MSKPLDDRAPSAELRPDFLSDGHLSVGPSPRFPEVPRWATVANVPTRDLPAIPTYTCRRVTSPLTIDGKLDEPEWDRAEWSAPMGRIETGIVDAPAASVALLWDNTYLYVGFRIADPDVRGTAVRHHEQLYMLDDDAEVFVNGVGRYYEVGVNPINTIYEFRWTWLEPLIARQDYAAIEALFKTRDFVYYTARAGELAGRIGDMNWELPGLRHAVAIEGTLNAPHDRDTGWTVEYALPWSGLAQIGVPSPQAGQQLRIQAYRAFHNRDEKSARAEEMARAWPGATPYEGYTWSTMGNGNVHNPERWPVITLSDEPA
ncbi:carbohydrate-binding family 9-like protein [Devosia sp.]|uniref:carbohydrate-binding family 9-like protein n=1 Tax=Devosia sp. TaxID=1871048 RepID=UPI001AD144E5|nr:carbohydrate-binding family 9-like protein [Devosia sp.]MBN9308553.1 carbohydrate-binding family 9-like protein [Devosia sp.]